MEENGGLITHDDMKNYNAILREPVEGKYRNYKIYGMGPPSSVSYTHLTLPTKA
mgnify:CR=1 FL=1